MKRRTLLGGLGATLGSSLAGCTGFSSADGETPTDTPATTPTETARQHGDANSLDTESAQPNSERPEAVRETVVLPWRETLEEGIQPHHLRIWNAAGKQREITVSVSPLEPETLTGLTTSHHVPANEAVAIELRQPATYAATIQVDAMQVTSFELGENWFDCNSSSTRVKLGPDGAVDRTEMTTLVACTGATVETPTEAP